MSGRTARSKHATLPNPHRSTPGHRRPPQLARYGITTTFYDDKETPVDEPVKLDPADIAPPRHQVDESCAGIPLEQWKHGDPYEGVKTAVRFVADHPTVPCIAYCHDPIREVFQQTDTRQKKAGNAWAAKEYPHLKVKMRTMTLPYMGIGNDVVVVYADVQKPPKS